MTIRDIRAAHAAFTPALNVVALLRQQIRQSHTDLDAAAAMWLYPPPSSSAWSPPAGLYLHALCVEDISIQSVLREDAPLFTSFWPNLGGTTDRAVLRQYARAVYASTDAYVAQLTPDGLRQVVDVCRPGLGQQTVGWVIRRFVVAELARICSEISRATASSKTPSTHAGVPHLGPRRSRRDGTYPGTSGRTPRQ